MEDGWRKDEGWMEDGWYMDGGWMEDGWRMDEGWKEDGWRMKDGWIKKIYVSVHLNGQLGWIYCSNSILLF
jgi:hypothetical protein